MDRIIEYLTQKYNPSGVIVYGSFAGNTNNLNSDFDAMLIYDGTEELHDHSVVDGTVLDVFVYPAAKFENGYNADEFIRIWDGKIILDETGLLGELKEKAKDRIAHYAGKSKEENERNLAWCEKMLKRTQRKDMEGQYRLHWLLVDSLEIYFDRKRLFYFGPKKAIRQMQENDPESAEIYRRALEEPTQEHLSDWVEQLKRI